MVTQVPSAVRDWCWRNGWGEVEIADSLSGGDVSDARRLAFSNGRSLVLKVKAGAPADMFACEAEGLAALAATKSVTIPTTYLAGPDFLLLEDLQPAPPTPSYWEDFGRQLAALHLTTHTQYGFAHDNYCGETRQSNSWTESGYEFFAEQRLLPQARLAFGGNRLEAADLHRIEHICRRLPDLVPPQSPALIHGDLWKGNALTGPHGEPALIDPAAHYGWAEAEIAMTLLFGDFPRDFYDGYAASYPLAPGWRGRMDLYNLYHLLNHLNVFGAVYLGRVQDVLRRYW